MSNWQKFFRSVWRVDAVLILVAAGAVTFGVGALVYSEVGSRRAQSREAEAGVIHVAPNAKVHLVLARASLVPGTEVIRAYLQADGGSNKFSSSGYAETRNILYLEPGDKIARWLLPDHDHFVVHNTDIADEKDKAHRTVATVVLVKSSMATPETTTGKLLLLDPAAKKVVEVADNVRDIHVAALSEGELKLVFERDRRLVYAAFEPGSLAKRKEQPVEVPQLK